MSIKWKSTQYRVKDIIKLDDELELELRPEYQRHSVWSHAAKIMLIDSILRDIPMPKIYVHVKTTPKGKTIRSVIDGQQRIRAILEFITLPEFKLAAPYSGEYFGYSRGGPHRLDRLGADLRWNTPAIMPPPKAVLISCIRQ